MIWQCECDRSACSVTRISESDSAHQAGPLDTTFPDCQQFVTAEIDAVYADHCNLIIWVPAVMLALLRFRLLIWLWSDTRCGGPLQMAGCT